MHLPGNLFALVHPIRYGLQDVLLYTLPSFGSCLPDLLASFLGRPYHNIVVALIVFYRGFYLCFCRCHDITTANILPQAAKYSNIQFAHKYQLTFVQN